MSTCKASSRHPVIIATGEKSLDQLDFQLPGPIELEWRRKYRSGDARSDGWFGQGWSHPLATELWLEDDVLRYWDEQGREILLPALEVGQEHFEAYEQFTLQHPEENHWVLSHNQGFTHHYRRRHVRQRKLSLEVVRDRNFRHIRLHFNDGDFGDHFDEKAVPPRPRRIVDSVGRTLQLAWTTHNQLSQVVVESGGSSVVIAAYRFGESDAGGSLLDLLDHTDANGHTRSFSWEQHLLVGYTLATGQRFSNRYDKLTPAGRVTESLALDDSTGDWFDYNGQTTRVCDRLGRETIYVSNARQDLVAVHDAAGNVSRTAYDTEGRPESTTDALGRDSTTEYDSFGNLTLITDAAGNTTKLEYNALNLPSKLTDAMGGEWLREYDERGNLVVSTDPLGNITGYEVDALGQVTAIIDALGKRKTLEWDDASNLIAYTDCSGHSTRYTYDPLGNLCGEKDALGRTTVYKFDAHGQLHLVKQPDGATHRYTWDGEGNLLRYVNPLGHATEWNYNGARAPLVRTDALDHTLAYQYDKAGRLSVLTNENGQQATFGYDVLDRLVDEIGFDGRHQRYAYNAAGEMTHLIERGCSEFGPGKLTRFEHDAVGRMIEKQHIGESLEHAASSQFEYDPLGRLTRASNAMSDVTFEYDPLGQLLGEKQQLRGWVGDNEFELKHEYDPLGNRTQTRLPNGREVNHLLYGSGHLHQVNLDGEVVSDFERDALHREVKRSQGKLQSEFEYDRAGRLSIQKVAPVEASGAGSETGLSALEAADFSALDSGSVMRDVQSRLKGVIERHYRYDPNGQLEHWLDQHRGLTQYSYDDTGRITKAQIGLLKDWGAIGVQPDDPGNLTGMPMASNEQFYWDAASNQVPLQTELSHDGLGGHYVQGNRLRAWQDTRYEYDDHGNLIERTQGERGSATQGRTFFTWDAAHQLVRADVEQGTDAIATVQRFNYGYDALGRRVAKGDEGGVTYFAWDEDRMVQEQCGCNETIYLYHPESFICLAQIHNGVLHHVHTDHLGTPLEASNDEGEVTWRVTCGAWGNVVAEEEVEVNQRLGFQGQYRDCDIELNYNRYRFYSSRVGRFISQDLIGLQGGVNLYRYATNPVNWVDVLGLNGKWVTVGRGRIRIDQAHVAGVGQKHAHCQTKSRKEEVVVNVDGSQSHDGRGSISELTKAEKVFLRGKGFAV